MSRRLALGEDPFVFYELARLDADHLVLAGGISAGNLLLVRTDAEVVQLTVDSRDLADRLAIDFEKHSGEVVRFAVDG